MAERVAAESVGAGSVAARRPGARGGQPARELRIQVATDPTRLVDDMVGTELVVVVDAVRSGAPAGTVTVVETGAGRPPLPARTGPDAAATHGIGLADALELARALDRLPARVVVVGVEAAGFEVGAPTSPGARAGIPEAVGAVLDLIRDVAEVHHLDLRVPPVWLPHPTAHPPTAHPLAAQPDAGQPPPEAPTH